MRTHTRLSIRVVEAALLTCFALIAAAPRGRAQSWEAATPFPGGAGTALLQTNGNVLVQDTTGSGGYGVGMWFELVPDENGNYAKGFWFPVPLPPAGYAPQFYGSAVLPSRKILFEGGEYNGTSKDNTTLGALYNPESGLWTSVTPPSGWTHIGDAPTVVLADGTFMMGSCCSKKQALLDAKTLTWTSTGTGKADSNSEEGWTLLPGGKVLAIDSNNGTESEIYDPTTGAWTLAGKTTVSLTNSCGGLYYPEIGPAVLRPNGTVFAVGANGNTAIYNSNTSKWSTGPTFPSGLGVVDGPAAILPDGNVLVGAAPMSPCFSLGLEFFEFDGTSLNPVPAPPNAPYDTTYYTRMVVLPTGNVLMTDGSSDVEIYNPAGSAKSAWKPTITSFPATVTRGTAYTVKGTQLNGLSQGAAYGDDMQAATNFPLVRVINNSTGHKFYAETKNFSTMGVQTGSTVVSCTFTVPTTAETGSSTMVVVANGVASKSVSIIVK